MMTDREQRYLRQYGKRLGTLFILFERQVDFALVLLAVSIIIILWGISFLFTVESLALGYLPHPQFESPRGAEAYVVGITFVFVVLFLIGIFFIGNTYAAYTKLEEELSRKGKEA